MPQSMLIARHGDIECLLLPAMCNRHGLITGATGTGKTVTLQVMAERLSDIGVPVFMADVKGDLAGLSQPGRTSAKFAERLQLVGVEAPPFAGRPDGVLGRVRRAGPSGARDRLGPGSAAARAASSS